jgi:hypothetical protein
MQSSLMPRENKNSCANHCSNAQGNQITCPQAPNQFSICFEESLDWRPFEWIFHVHPLLKLKQNDKSIIQVLRINKKASAEAFLIFIHLIP